MIDAIIPFCTYDSKYIYHTIQGAKSICENIYVIYFDKLFNGEDENLDLIDEIMNDNLDCRFLKGQYKPGWGTRYHHNLQREIGIQASKADYKFLIDADEVFEGNRLNEWLRTVELKDVTTFSNYWYFRSPLYQATTFEDSPVLVKSHLFNNLTSFHELERGIFKYASGTKELGVMGLDGLPMCHHYSWAMSKEDMIKKVANWGHNGDKDWVSLVEEEFSHPFNGTDFVHGYSYKILEKAYIE